MSNIAIINWVNNKIESEKQNSLGISLMYIMVSSGIASLTAALSVNKEVSILTLAICTCLAMGVNVAILSQQSFKICTWFFIISVCVNVFLLAYQIINLF